MRFELRRLCSLLFAGELTVVKGESVHDPLRSSLTAEPRRNTS
jgi:hypothetical protein